MRRLILVMLLAVAVRCGGWFGCDEVSGLGFAADGSRTGTRRERAIGLSHLVFAEVPALPNEVFRPAMVVTNQSRSRFGSWANVA